MAIESSVAITFYGKVWRFKKEILSLRILQVNDNMKMFVRRISAPRHPAVWGVGSLGNISGKYVSFRRYMQGNNADDLKRDWQIIGQDMRIAMSRMRK